jgi:hypothetical protein
MTQRVPPERYPWWVKFTLLGSRTRKSQWFWIGFELVVGAVLVWTAFGESGAGRQLYVIAAAWAFVLAGLSIATVQWVDRNGEWRQ